MSRVVCMEYKLCVLSADTRLILLWLYGAAAAAVFATHCVKLSVWPTV